MDNCDRKTYVVNNYTLDVIDNIVYEGKIFTFPHMKSDYRKSIVKYVENKGGTVVKARLSNIDYYVVDTDDGDSLNSVEKLIEKRGDNQSPVIISVWDFCRMTGAKVLTDTETPKVEFLEDGTKKSINGVVVSVIDELHIAGVAFAMPKMKSSYKDIVTSFIQKYGGYVFNANDYGVDCFITDVSDGESVAACERQLKKRNGCKMIALTDFCELTGVRLGQPVVDPSELNSDGRYALKSLNKYYAAKAQEEGAYYGSLGSLKYMNNSQLLKEARENGLFDPPVRSNDDGGDYCYISYSNIDSTEVKDIVLKMQEDNCRIWCGNGTGAEKSEDEETLLNKRRNAVVSIVFLSEAYTQSTECMNELKAALDEGKNVIPIYLDDTELSDEIQEKINELRVLRVGALSPTDFYAALYSSAELQQTRDLSSIIAFENEKKLREAKERKFLEEKEAYEAEQAREKSIPDEKYIPDIAPKIIAASPEAHEYAEDIGEYVEVQTEYADENTEQNETNDDPVEVIEPAAAYETIKTKEPEENDEPDEPGEALIASDGVNVPDESGEELSEPVEENTQSDGECAESTEEIIGEISEVITKEAEKSIDETEQLRSELSELKQTLADVTAEYEKQIAELRNELEKARADLNADKNTKEECGIIRRLLSVILKK